jgi:cytochrome o ubiquinol oxidase subunit 2
MAGTTIYLLAHLDTIVLHPAGIIGEKQRNLLLFTTILAMFVVVPVFILTFFIAYKYRASNTKATYSPNWNTHRLLETLWWGIPCAIIFVLAVITWQSSHALDPYRPLDSTTKPVRVQVVALPWKWLFIYPDQQIATLNYLNVPEKTPINFEITADAPMNSFWVPALGGQVYAMSGMTTRLHLQANKPGTFAGVSANLSGEGFADMRFAVTAMKESDFTDWYKSLQNSSNKKLDTATYTTMAVPGTSVTIKDYRLENTELYNDIIMKYMTPSTDRDMHHELAEEN